MRKGSGHRGDATDGWNVGWSIELIILSMHIEYILSIQINDGHFVY